MRKWEGRGDGMRQEEGGEWREDEVRGIRNIGRSGGRGGHRKTDFKTQGLMILRNGGVGGAEEEGGGV